MGIGWEKDKMDNEERVIASIWTGVGVGVGLVLLMLPYEVTRTIGWGVWTVVGVSWLLIKWLGRTKK